MRLGKLAVLAIALVFGGNLLASDDPICEKLKETIKLDFDQPLPSEVHAGSIWDVTLKLDIQDPDLLDKFDFALLQFSYNHVINSQMEGAWSKHLNVAEEWIKEFSGTTMEGKSGLRRKVKIPENFIGMYLPDPTVQARIKVSSKYCFVRLNDAPKTPLIITNDPKKADILPPSLLSIKLEKENGARGHQLSIRFLGQDKSPILTGKLPEDYANHVQLLGHGLPPINSYNEIEETGNKGWYRTTVDIPQDAKPGIYYLNTLNVHDIYGNKSAHLPAEQTKLIKFVVAD